VVQNIDLNSGDWKETNEPMYYSQQKRSWYCKECNFLTQSPRTAGAHAKEHELPLPFSRNKIEVELVPVVQPQLQPQTPKAEPNYRSYSENRNYSYSQNNRECNDITSPNYVPTTPLGAEISKRLQGRKLVNAMRMTGEFTDEEIKKTERELGLNFKS